MLRFSLAFLFAMWLAAPAPVSAQYYSPRYRPGWSASRLDRIAGDYVNQSNGKGCSVYRKGRDYVFVNENGSRARFAFTRPGRLEMVAGEWDPDVIVSVGQDRRGRTILRFDSAN